MRYKSIFNKESFSKKNVVVTGGGSGIGRCIAHELSSLGSDIILVGRNKEKLETVQKEIKSSNGNASFYVCDIREEDHLKQEVSKIADDFGFIHALSHNAGILKSYKTDQMKVADFKKILDVNVIGTFIINKILIPHLIKQFWMFQIMFM